MKIHAVWLGVLLFLFNHLIGGKAMAMDIKSSAFDQEGMIPSEYSCDGSDVSPPLSWTDPPENTQSFALICDDPDAPMGTWVHWVVYNIPSSKREMDKGFVKDKELSDGTRQGISDFRRVGYGGPCPPGGTHRYYFKLYALDTILNLESGATKKELLKAMEGHQLAEAVLMGRYKRK